MFGRRGDSPLSTQKETDISKLLTNVVLLYLVGGEVFTVCVVHGLSLSSALQLGVSC